MKIAPATKSGIPMEIHICQRTTVKTHKINLLGPKTRKNVHYLRDALVTLPSRSQPPAARSRAMHLMGFACSQVRNPSKKHIYQRATVKDLKINLLGKIKQTANAYDDDGGKWAPQEKSTFE